MEPVEEESGGVGLEGGGSGGGTDIVHQEEAQPCPSSKTLLIVTAILVGIVLLIPTLWAAGVYAGLVTMTGVNRVIAAAYLALFILLSVAAVFYFRAQLVKG